MWPHKNKVRVVLYFLSPLFTFCPPGPELLANLTVRRSVIFKILRVSLASYCYKLTNWHTHNKTMFHTPTGISLLVSNSLLSWKQKRHHVEKTLREWGEYCAIKLKNKKCKKFNKNMLWFKSREHFKFAPGIF